MRSGGREIGGSDLLHERRINREENRREEQQNRTEKKRLQLVLSYM